MKLSEKCKEKGFDTLLELGRISGETTQTLTIWNKNRLPLLNLVLEKASEEKASGTADGRTLKMIKNMTWGDKEKKKFIKKEASGMSASCIATTFPIPDWLCLMAEHLCENFSEEESAAFYLELCHSIPVYTDISGLRTDIAQTRLNRLTALKKAVITTKSKPIMQHYLTSLRDAEESGGHFVSMGLPVSKEGIEASKEVKAMESIAVLHMMLVENTPKNMGLQTAEIEQARAYQDAIRQEKDVLITALKEFSLPDRSVIAA